MNADQKNHITMGRTVASLLEDDRWASLVAGTAALAADKDVLDAKLTRVDEIAQRLGHRTSGARRAKIDARETLTARTRVVAGGLRRLGRATNNPDLVDQASVSYSAMIYDRGEQANAIASNIMKLATDNTAALVAYNVDAAKLGALREALDAYKKVIVAPRNVTVDNTEITEELESAIGEMTLTLTDLDDVVETLHVSNPDFYLAYRAARIIIDLPGGHASPPPPADPTQPTPPPA